MKNPEGNESLRGITRREFFGATAGVAAVAAFPAAHSLPVSHITRPALTPASVGTNLAGASVSLSAYHVKNYLRAANIYDSYVGLPLARTIQKIYLPLGSFPSQPPLQMAQLAPAGCQFIVDVRPSKKRTSTEQNRLANFLAMLNGAGFSYRVALYAESDNPASGFASPQEWFAYWSYYAPVVKSAGVLCDYDPGCSLFSQANAIAYFPSNPTPDELWMDYYATAFRNGERLDSLIAMAQAVGIKTGLAEWGWSAGPATFVLMTMPWWNSYCNYLLHLVGNGNLTLGSAYFNGVLLHRRVNLIGSSSDPRIPMIRTVSSAVQQAS